MFFYCHAQHEASCDGGRKAMSRIASCLPHTTNGAPFRADHTQSTAVEKSCLGVARIAQHYLPLLCLWVFCALLLRLCLFLIFYISVLLRGIAFLLRERLFPLQFFGVRLHKEEDTTCICLSDHQPSACVLETNPTSFFLRTICKFSRRSPLTGRWSIDHA